MNNPATNNNKNGYIGSSQETTYVALIQALEDKWERLCIHYLSVTPENSVWRFSRAITPDDPEQGWKIHISATILSANKIFEKVAPFLCSLGVLFKAPRSLLELKRMNCGLFYGFSQVGKFITVYPKTPQDAVSIAHKLHQLTDGFSCVAVPYDLPFRQNSCIYYRYGSFSTLAIENSDGTSIPAIRDPEGKLVPDLREPGAAVPSWATDPFVEKCHRSDNVSTTESPLKTTILAYEALSQRGKGGVYRALDLSVLPARLCVLKEGRRDGETDWDGRDGYWRVQHEAQVLSSLFLAGVEVPRVYTTFQDGMHYYLVTEYLEGENLQSFLSKTKKIPIADALRYGIQLARLLDKIHSAGWVWRDCKPLNLILSKEGALRPLDFEGACPVDLPDRTPWGTNGYVPPEGLEEPVTGSRIPEDNYALGSTLHQLLSGRTPYGTYPLPAIGKLRRHIPPVVRQIISALLDPDSNSRPNARTVLQSLEQACSEIGIWYSHDGVQSGVAAVSNLPHAAPNPHR